MKTNKASEGDPRDRWSWKNVLYLSMGVGLLVESIVFNFSQKKKRDISSYRSISQKLLPPAQALSINFSSLIGSSLYGGFTEISQNSTLSDHFRRSERVVEVPDSERDLAFIHVGKTGGSTIASLLRNGCPLRRRKGGNPCPDRGNGMIPHETVASFRIKSYYHVTNVPFDEHTSFVVTTRNPLQRLVSAFAYHHPLNLKKKQKNYMEKKLKYVKEGKQLPKPPHDPGPKSNVVFACFDTLEDFYRELMVAESFARNDVPSTDARIQAKGSSYQRRSASVSTKRNSTFAMKMIRGRREQGDPLDSPRIIEYDLSQAIHTSNQDRVTLNCTQIAIDAVGGNDERIAHMYWNYRRYIGSMPPSKEVFVLRQEHLWEDWTKINQILGQMNDVVIPRGDKAELNKASDTLPVSADLNAMGTKVICRYIQVELHHYTNLLMRAVNLSNEDVLRSLLKVQASCPGLEL